MTTPIDLALANLTIQDVPNFRGTARKFDVVESTLRRRWKGQTVSRQEAISTHKQKLTDAQETSLIQQINRLTDRGIPSTSGLVKNFAEEIVKGPVGKNWTGQFVARHKKELKSLYLQNIDSKRTKSEYAPMFKQYYDLLLNAIETYHLTAENIYNWDEKGFLIGMANKTQRIMTLEALQSGRITQTSHDGSREFISLLACIGADGTALPPALIYKGESNTLQDTWLEDLNKDDEAFFATSINGWSSDVLGLNWLERVFQRCTHKKVGNRRRRLLIVDGHSSHVNMKFINKCDEFRILLLILPPHTTHRLQPLDVSLFSPLTSYYTIGLNDLMQKSLGMVNMTKRAFWSVFLPAWKCAFTVSNIASAFTKTGIFPYNPDLVLDAITKPQSSDSSDPLKTPMNSRAVRNMHRIFQIKPSKSLLVKILRANERLAAEHEIDQHIIKGLTISLKNEKKRRRRGKRLNLLGEEESGPQFFSPGRVQAARAWQATKEDEKLQRQQEIDEKKALAAATKAFKEAEKVERAKKTAEQRQMREEARINKLAEKQAQMELKDFVNRPADGGFSSGNASTGSKKPQKMKGKKAGESHNAVDPMGVEHTIFTTSRGRRTQRPQRFEL